MLRGKLVNTWSTIDVIQNEALDYQNEIEIRHDQYLILIAK